MQTKEIIYFDSPGQKNTDNVIKAVSKRAGELGIEYIVIASGSGNTALKFWEEFKNRKIQLISVTEHAGSGGADNLLLTEEMKKDLESKGIKTLMCSHALSGVERSITNKLGGVSRVEVIAHLLRRFGGEGLKVCVEVAVMAADAGLVPTTKEIIAVGGSGKGAECAIVLKSAHMNNFFDIEIREIIAKSRQRGKSENKE